MEQGQDLDDVPPPPSHPPPLLSDPQILALARQGHLPLPLSPYLHDLYSQLNRAASEFFALSASTKKDRYSAVNGSELGYVAIPGEKDYVTFRALTVYSETELEQLVAKVWQETFKLLYRALCDLAWGMNMSYHVWDQVVDGVSPIPDRLEEATPTMIRMFHYEPDTGIAEEHTDLGLLTLCFGDGEGLEVQVKDQNGENQWITYEEPTLLVGRTLRELTGGRLRTGVHRVIGNPNGRNSIIFALRPSIKHEIDMTMFPGGKGSIHMGAMWKKIWSGAFNVNAPREVREIQKEKGKSKEADHDDGGPYDITNSMVAITA